MTEEEYIATRDLALLRAVMRELGSVTHTPDIQGAARFVQSEIDRLEEMVERAMESNTGTEPK